MMKTQETMLLGHYIGSELLLMCIAGDSKVRREINKELDIRAIKELDQESIQALDHTLDINNQNLVVA